MACKEFTVEDTLGCSVNQGIVMQMKTVNFNFVQHYKSAELWLMYLNALKHAMSLLNRTIQTPGGLQ